MSEAVWYWREGPMQHGPITWEKLRSLAEAGKISPSDWVMREGWEDWKLACEANDSGVDAAAVGRPPEPPPLLPPLPPPNHPVAVGPPPPATLVSPFVGVAPNGTSVAPPPHPSFPMQAPLDMVPVPAMGSAALPMPMPLPPLAPEQTLVDLGPPAPSADGVSDGDVVQLRRVLRDGPDRERPAGQWNFAAMIALAASATGLLVLAFEMGLIGLCLGGWCLYAASTSGNNNGRSLAFTAVVVGALNVGFRVLCATVDLGLTM